MQQFFNIGKMPVIAPQFEVLTGRAIESVRTEIARLRLEVFREFPYLYEGTLEYEEQYIDAYIAVPDSVCVVARSGDEVVGISTGAPMNDEDLSFRGPFQRHGYKVSKIFYYGESVVRVGYRGMGLGARFMEAREAHARGLGRFDYLTFFTVERAPGDYRRPVDYFSPEAFWRKWGFRKHPELNTTFSWREVGEERETPKPMVFWLKYL